MRVTNNTYSDSLVNHLQTLARKHVSLQNQIATGQRIQSAEEDPLAMQQVLHLRDQSASATQYESNIRNHQEFASATHGAMRSLTKILDRASEIAHLADDLDSPEDLKSYATEINQLLEQAVQVSNTRFKGEYILAGTRSDAAAFTPARDTEGRITSVAFNGNNTIPESEIAAGATIASKVAGANSSGSGERGLVADDRYGADLFGHLIELRDQLQAGDVQTIASTTRATLQADEDHLLYHIANNGALQSRLEASLKSNEDGQDSLESEISRHADADVAETIIRLNQAQTSYQAALQSGGAILNMNLLDFLR